jgi:ketosteroid isomerase-like protein
VGIVDSVEITRVRWLFEIEDGWIVRFVRYTDPLKMSEIVALI